MSAQLSSKDAEAAQQLREYTDERLAQLFVVNGFVLVLMRSSENPNSNSVWERTHRLVLEEAKRRGLKLKDRLN